MKDKKMPFIIKEMNFNGNEYEINGIDLTKAQFYIRKNRELFKIVAPGDFKIITKGGNTYLDITNSTILTDVISVQVVYFLTITAGEYPTGVDPDINILTSNYNKLVEDFRNLWTYVKDQGFVADSTLMPVVFPLLRNGETWIFENGEMKATPLIAAETELQRLLDELIKNSENVLDDYVLTLTESSKTEINITVNDLKSEINALVGDSKNEIETLTENSKTEILEFLEEETENLLTKKEAAEIYVKNTDISSETETGIIQIANNSEALLATNNTKAITPLKMKQYIDSVFSGYVGETGYKKFNEGFIIQWGLIVTTGNYFTVTLPISFPQGKYQVLTTDSGSGRNAYGANPLTKNTFNLYGPSTSWSARWLAVGY